MKYCHASTHVNKPGGVACTSNSSARRQEDPWDLPSQSRQVGEAPDSEILPQKKKKTRGKATEEDKQYEPLSFTCTECTQTHRNILIHMLSLLSRFLPPHQDLVSLKLRIIRCTI